MTKTIKELAVELDLSKSYIDKIIRILELHTKLDKVGNRYVINKQQEKLIKTKISGSRTHTETHTKPNSNSSNKLDSEVDFLRKQLENRTAEIERLQKLLDQQQQLHLKTQQMLEEKTVLLEIKEQEQKKGFWTRLFGS